MKYKNYHEQKDAENIQRLREVLTTLLCQRLFSGNRNEYIDHDEIILCVRYPNFLSLFSRAKSHV